MGEIFKENINYKNNLIKGIQLKLDIAIDYTESNGKPNKIHSLHYTKEGYKNDYERAIESFGKILSNYNLINYFLYMCLEVYQIVHLVQIKSESLF